MASRRVVWARLPVVDPDGLVALVTRPMMRAADRLTEEITSASSGSAIWDTSATPMLGLALTGAGQSRASPCWSAGRTRASLLCAGHAAVAQYVTHVSRGSLDATQRADGWVHAAREAVALDGDNPAVPFAAGSAEIVTEAGIIDVLTEERDAHARTRATAQQAVDPNSWRAACLACQRSVVAGADRGLRRGSVAPDSVVRCHAVRCRPVADHPAKPTSA